MNRDYREFLMKNTNMIMMSNYNHVSQFDVPSIKQNTYPFLFNGFDDRRTPYGYETSIPKEKYMKQLDNNRTNILKENI